MKVNRFGSHEGFPAFDITLTIESEEEARALYAIFNYIPNTDLFPDGVSLKIREKIGERFSNLGSGEVIAKGVTYDSFYRPKEKSK